MLTSIDSLEQEANEQMQKQEANEQTQKQQAVLELARKTQSYNTNATRVALVMSKTRPDDLRWLRDYLETQYVHHDYQTSRQANDDREISGPTTPLLSTQWTKTPRANYSFRILRAVAKSPPTFPLSWIITKSYPLTRSSSIQM
jgi:hypothetical protein